MSDKTVNNNLTNPRFDDVKNLQIEAAILSSTIRDMVEGKVKGLLGGPKAGERVNCDMEPLCEAPACLVDWVKESQMDVNATLRGVIKMLETL